MIRIKFEILEETINKVFLRQGIEPGKSELLAKIMSESSLDGFQSHGINRVPMMVEYIRKDFIKPGNEMFQIGGNNLYKQFDGNFGIGPINAWNSTTEVMRIANENGLGLVALRNNNHWQRAGTYGWKAANEGFILICWTNTIPNLPPYGSKKNLVGNNPLVIAIPRKGGNIVLDMAMSQFSYGKIASYARRNKELPEFGGYDENNNLTKDAQAIRKKGRHLPIGFWKGSSLSFILDIVAAILSGGNTTRIIGEKGVDTGLSQIFIAIDPSKFGDSGFREALITQTIEQFKSVSIKEGSDIRYPGEATLRRRKENLGKGIPLEEEIWEKVNGYL
ncbi:2,3-diketo-L-gulonate reductase [bacterium BMS3Abin04]|nr:2,3-diketo-L-gulonate reductase [bacterium BMS3Abin04]